MVPVNICLFLLIALLACGKPKQIPLAPPTDQQTDRDTSPSPGDSLLPPSLFPHSDNWAEPAIHGGWVSKNGTTECFKCHTTTQVSVEGPPACSSCHILFPHSEGWVSGGGHGTSVLRNGNVSCATQCHGTDLKGGLSKISCQLCHSIYPHSQNWNAADQHGITAKGDGKLSCKGCHGADYKGGSSGISCYSCHAKYPHESDWRNPTKHGAEVIANGTQSCATACHGLNFQGGLSNVACTQCHATFPHPQGWNTFEGHGQYAAITLNKDFTSCKNCHGDNLQGGNFAVSCFSCHINYPHPANWREAAQHGVNAYGAGKNSCATANCHGTDFNGSAQAPSCRSCHADFPHTNPKWMTLEVKKENLRDESFHGDRFIRETKRGNTTTCTGCHGTDFDRVMNNTSCIGCHTDGITHRQVNSVAWNTGNGHGKFFSDRFRSTDNGAKCFNCHGSPFEFNTTQTPAIVTNQSFCYSCHTAYPHIAFINHNVRSLWEPVIATTCGPRTVSNWGHANYVGTNNPLFAGTAATCGSAGSCHSQGYRSFQLTTFANISPCGDSCHGTGTRVLPLPAIVPCRPPPELINPAPPLVIATQPPSRGTNVAGNVIIIIQFSEAMRENSLTGIAPDPNPITLTIGGGLVAIRVSCENNDWCKTVTLRPTLPLREDGSPYQVNISAAVKDFDGTPMVSDYSWGFNVANTYVDTTPPTVTATIPINRGGSISRTPTLQVTFSEPMDAGSVTGDGAFSLVGGGRDWALQYGVCVANTDCGQVTFQLAPNTQLYGNLSYTARVNTIVADKAGNHLTTRYSWTFTTRR